MDKLHFFEVDKNYISYLKKFENRIPNISYETNDKFVCGIVLKINDHNYYAPISSFNKQQRTNMLIHNEQNNPISSIRFSYMFPAPPGTIAIKDFSKLDYGYKRLLMTELNYCNKNIEAILSKAKYVYNIGINRNHPLAQNCCNFNLLEAKSLEFTDRYLQATRKEIAATIDNSIPSIKKAIIRTYISEFPAIKHVSEHIAKEIHKLNQNNGHKLSIDDIKKEYKSLGMQLEQNPLPNIKDQFRNLQNITDEFKRINMIESRSQQQSNNSQAINKPMKIEPESL